MILLALESALASASAAVWRDGRVAGFAKSEGGGSQAEALFGLIARALEEAGASYTDLDRIAVSIGPGSFTGVRLGVAAARGLALALGVPAIGVTTLEALGRAALGREDALIPEAARILSVIDARRGELYAQSFRRLGGGLVSDDEPRLVSAAGFVPPGPRPAVVIGSGAPLVAHLFPGAGIDPFEEGPDARIVARIASTRETAGPPSPLYLRAPDAKLPARGAR